MGHQIKKEPERAILCAVSLPGKTEHTEHSIEELGRLAETAGAVIVDTMIQARRAIHPLHYLGSGKLNTLKTLAEEQDADLVILTMNCHPRNKSSLNKN